MSLKQILTGSFGRNLKNLSVVEPTNLKNYSHVQTKGITLENKQASRDWKKVLQSSVDIANKILGLPKSKDKSLGILV